MDRHSWKGEQKTYEQVQRERLGSTEFETHEAAKESQAERAERAFAAASVKLTPEQSRELAERHVKGLEESHNRGQRLMFREGGEAMTALREIVKHGFTVSPGFESHLRRVAGMPDKQELAPPAPEPYEEHAMGMHE